MKQTKATEECRSKEISTIDYDAVLFDLDGVVTSTARLHAATWKQLFDGFLAGRETPDGTPQAPFDVDKDYENFVDGKPRNKGVESFLRSREIDLPFGTLDDPPEAETICGLGNRKNELFHALLRRDRVKPFSSSVEFINDVRSRGLKTAVVSSSRNCATILEAAGIVALFDAQVDGVYAVEHNLKGKPDPDTFLEAARLLSVTPGRAVVFEDAVAGVQAGRNGKFGLVVGVDRAHHADDLRQNGADIVVSQLTEIRFGDTPSAGRQIDDLPSALQHVTELVKTARRRRLVFFLDYDGTLTPIVDRPELAVLSDDMRATLQTLARRYPVAVISGRDLHDVQDLVGVDNLFYAGSHGFRIAGPGDWRQEFEHGTEFLPTLDQVEGEVRKRIEGIPGALVERKHLSIAVHYRLVDDSDVPRVASIIDDVLADHPNLRMSPGKKVFDLQPNIDWNKGKAILWLLDALDLDGNDVLPIYIGDDLTDEDAFSALRDRGLGIVVKGADRITAASYALDDPDQVRQFFDELVSAQEDLAHG